MQNTANAASDLATGETHKLAGRPKARIDALQARSDLGDAVTKLANEFDLNLAYLRRDLYATIVITDEDQLKGADAAFQARLKQIDEQLPAHRGERRHGSTRPRSMPS